MRLRWKIALGGLALIVMGGLYIGNELSEIEAQGKIMPGRETLLSLELTFGFVSIDKLDGRQSALLWILEYDPEPDGIVKILLTHGARPNFQDTDGTTPLMAAAFSDDMEATKLLLAHGADPNLEDEEGNTALFDLSTGYAEIARLLVASGADPCHRNHDGKTPFAYFGTRAPNLAAVFLADCSKSNQ